MGKKGRDGKGKVNEQSTKPKDTQPEESTKPKNSQPTIFKVPFFINLMDQYMFGNEGEKQNILNQISQRLAQPQGLGDLLEIFRYHYSNLRSFLKDKSRGYHADINQVQKELELFQKLIEDDPERYSKFLDWIARCLLVISGGLGIEELGDRTGLIIDNLLKLYLDESSSSQESEQQKLVLLGLISGKNCTAEINKIIDQCRQDMQRQTNDEKALIEIGKALNALLKFIVELRNRDEYCLNNEEHKLIVNKINQLIALNETAHWLMCYLSFAISQREDGTGDTIQEKFLYLIGLPGFDLDNFLSFIDSQHLSQEQLNVLYSFVQKIILEYNAGPSADLSALGRMNGFAILDLLTLISQNIYDLIVSGPLQTQVQIPEDSGHQQGVGSGISSFDSANQAAGEGGQGAQTSASASLNSQGQTYGDHEVNSAGSDSDTDARNSARSTVDCSKSLCSSFANNKSSGANSTHKVGELKGNCVQVTVGHDGSWRVVLADTDCNPNQLPTPFGGEDYW